MKKVIVIIILIILIVFFVLENHSVTKEIDTKIFINNGQIKDQMEDEIVIENNKKEIDDWKLVLVNFENPLPENFEPELTNIDKNRQFDSRAVDSLLQMLEDMKKQGYKNIWPQSTYRSVARQEELFSEKVKMYMNSGKTKEEAEKLTLQKINKPRTSEHNLGLAVDFNNVDYKFEKTKEYNWLIENADNYGFILRYTREKKDITKVDYEPWHWRYVGEENAKEMNELDMCLEEYVIYKDYNKNI